VTHVDATIRLFAPDLEVSTIPAKVIRRSDGWFASGEVKRRVLDSLRRAARAMREISGLTCGCGRHRPDDLTVRWRQLTDRSQGSKANQSLREQKGTLGCYVASKSIS
jgi:hypothetical protein